MEIPQKIQFKQDFKNESKVFAQFTSNDHPEYIRVKGTDDFTKVKKNKKEWFSKSKYPNLAITLQLFKNNDIVSEPSYLADGTLYNPPAENICDIIGFDARIADNNNVIVEWVSVKESNIKNYQLFYQENADARYSSVANEILPKGSVKPYSIIDTSESDKSLYIYTLVVFYSDGNGSVIASNPVFEDNYL